VKWKFRSWFRYLWNWYNNSNCWNRAF